MSKNAKHTRMLLEHVPCSLDTLNNYPLFEFPCDTLINIDIKKSFIFFCLRITTYGHHQEKLKTTKNFPSAGLNYQD